MVSRKFLLVLTAALFIAGESAAVTIEQAFAWYSGGDFEKAYQAYKELAEIGNVQAQLNIGAMYARGEYVEKNFVEAYAWVSLAHAAEPGDTSQKFKTAIEKALTAEKKEKAEERFLILKKQYSQEAIERNLLPSEVVQFNEGFVEAKLKVRNQPDYPPVMAQEGGTGIVDIQFIVDEDGTTRHHSILSATNKHFKRAALKALKRDQFEPATVNGKPVKEFGRRMRYSFLMHGDKADMKRVASLVEPLKEAALSGGGWEKFKYAYTLDMVQSYGSGLKGFDDDALDSRNRWFVKSAQDGFSVAKYELGRIITYGQQCGADSKKGFYWLEKAAQENVTDAQLMLGMELINGVRYQKDEKSGLAWVKKAADGGLNHAQLTYAWILAVHKNEKIRDAQKALDYVKKIELKEYQDKLTYYETLAAVYAALGQYNKGMQAHEKAMEEIEKYDLPHEKLDRIKRALIGKKAYTEEMA